MDFEVDFKVNLELAFSSHPMQGTVLDFGFHAVDFQIPVLDSSFFKKLELGFRISIVGGIPNSLS